MNEKGGGWAIGDEDFMRDDPEFIVNARTDLPAVLEAAMVEHDVLKTLVHVARGISKSALMGLDIAYGEIMQLDDAIMGAGAVVDETRWLEEDKQCK